jgi:hypothetical protein
MTAAGDAVLPDIIFSFFPPIGQRPANFGMLLHPHPFIFPRYSMPFFPHFSPFARCHFSRRSVQTSLWWGGDEEQQFYMLPLGHNPPSPTKTNILPSSPIFLYIHLHPSLLIFRPFFLPIQLIHPDFLFLQF